MLNTYIAQHLSLRLRQTYLRIIRFNSMSSNTLTLSSSIAAEVKLRCNPCKYAVFKPHISRVKKKQHCHLNIPLHSQKLFNINAGHETFLNATRATGSLQVRQFSSEVSEPVANQIFVWLSNSAPVHYAQKMLLFFHETSGLPWWATIVLTTILLRTLVTLPLAVYQNYILAKCENIQTSEMPEILKQLKQETAFAVKKYGWTEKQAQLIFRRSVKKQWLKLVMRDNCHPFKAGVLVWVQLPMWISSSVALRNLALMLPNNDAAAKLTLLELSVGGVGWVHNLAVPDQMLILPVILGMLNLAIVELQSMTKIRKESKLQKFTLNMFRIISLVMIPIAASVPSCMSLYWVTSSTYGLIQNMVMLSPQLRRSVGIPQAPSELEHPYSHIASEAKTRINRISTWQSNSKA